MKQTHTSSTHYQVVIVGGGASGLMCAITAADRGKKVLVLDHADNVGSKILISGGGRCNFSNMNIESENYLSENPYFTKSALSRYSNDKFISLLEKHNISYQERKFGQLFCKDKADSILGLLLKECAGKVKIQRKCRIKSIEKKEYFIIKTGLGDYLADSLVIATGGLSYPGIGAAGFGYQIAKQFGLNVVPCRPGLTPLLWNNNDLTRFRELAGISIEVSMTSNGQSFRDSLLFTHKGISGPVVLQISNYWQPGDEIIIDFLPDNELNKKIEKWKIEKPKTELKNLLAVLLSKRLAQCLLNLSEKNKPVNQYNSKEIKKIAAKFHQWTFIPKGTEGYKVGEVTIGGVDTGDISSKTFEAKNVKGLYFIGEVLDVTGWLGGYNLHWAWASGHCAGLFVV